MHIGFYAGRRVALLNRAAPSLIDRCVFCGKPTLLIVSFPVASSLTCCMHQQMHMLANFGRSICARSSSSQGLCIIRLAACLSCLVCMRACEVRLVSFPCRPLTIISLCSAFINASHLNCVCRTADGPGGRSSATSSPSTSFVAVGSCLRLQAVLLPHHAFEWSSLVVGVRHPSRLQCVC